MKKYLFSNWNDLTKKPPSDKLCIFYDDQTGKEFVDYGSTEKPYTYWIEQFKTNSMNIEYPIDATGRQVKIGDKVQGEGFLSCQDGFKIDLRPIVTVYENDGVLFFGGVSAKSFPKFWIINNT